MKENQRENQRVKLSKRLLREALIDILQDTPFSKVTISEVCAKAEVNRTTFYKHYSDEFDLYYDIENEALDMLKKCLTENRTNSIEVILTYFYDNRKLAYVLFNSNVNSDLPQKIFSLQVINNMIEKKYNSKERDYKKAYYFICYGGYALIKDWINTSYECTAKEMAEFLYTTANKILI